MPKESKKKAQTQENDQLLKAAIENDFTTAKKLIACYTDFSLPMSELRQLNTDTATWVRIILKDPDLELISQLNSLIAGVSIHEYLGHIPVPSGGHILSFSNGRIGIYKEGLLCFWRIHFGYVEQEASLRMDFERGTWEIPIHAEFQNGLIALALAGTSDIYIWDFVGKKQRTIESRLRIAVLTAHMNTHLVISGNLREEASEEGDMIDCVEVLNIETNWMN